MPAAFHSQIIRSVCEYFDISEYEIKRKTNDARHSFPRHVAAYLIQNDGDHYPQTPGHSRYTLKEIGKLLVWVGNKPFHHTTISSGIQRIEQFLADPRQSAEFAAAIQKIRDGYGEPIETVPASTALDRNLKILRARNKTHPHRRVQAPR